MYTDRVTGMATPVAMRRIYAMHAMRPKTVVNTYVNGDTTSISKTAQKGHKKKMSYYPSSLRKCWVHFGKRTSARGANFGIYQKTGSILILFVLTPKRTPLHFASLTSLCSASCVNCKRGTSRICCGAPCCGPALPQQSIDIFYPPGLQQQTSRTLDRRTDRQKNGRCTDT